MISAPMTRYGRLTLDAQRRQLRSDAFTAAEWTANNPILQLGELGSEKDTNKIKVGDGVTAWNDLPYSGGSEAQTIQVEELPEARADELGNIYQFVGTTGDTYTNGYFYKCTGAGEPVVYSWSQVDVQPAPEALPDQTGQSGKFLTTDGTDASWATLNALQNTATGTDALSIGGTASDSIQAVNVGIDSRASSAYATTVGYGTRTGALGTAIGNEAKATGSTISGGSVAVGAKAKCEKDKAVAVGVSSSANGVASICIGYVASTNSKGTVVLNASGRNETINDTNTVYVLNENGTYKVLDANGYIPAARLGTGYDATKTQTLKNIQGVLTWVDD